MFSSSYIIKIPKSIIMGIYHLIPQICMSTYNIPGATPCSELQNSKNLKSCPRGALSSGKKIDMKMRYITVWTYIRKQWFRVGLCFSEEEEISP